MRFCEGESAELDKKRGSIQYFLHLVGVSGQKAACRRSSVCSDLSKPIRISYSRGDMYSNILWKIFIPRETLTHKVMFKPFVCPVLLIPLGLLPLRCPGPVYIYARIHAQTHTHTHQKHPQKHTLSQTCTQAHTLDPGQLLRQVARTAKPLQQLSSLGSCRHNNSRHDAPAYD